MIDILNDIQNDAQHNPYPTLAECEWHVFATVVAGRPCFILRNHIRRIGYTDADGHLLVSYARTVEGAADEFARRTGILASLADPT